MKRQYVLGVLGKLIIYFVNHSKWVPVVPSIKNAGGQKYDTIILLK